VKESLQLKNHVRIRISSTPGVAIGEILEIRPVDELPDLDGFETTGEYAPRSILLERKVSRVAVIGYTLDSGQEVMFMALEIDGQWWDLKGQRLKIEVVQSVETS
jgi:hypothetical protein